MTTLNRLLSWLARRHPHAAMILAGGMRPSGRDKYLQFIDDGMTEREYASMLERYHNRRGRPQAPTGNESEAAGVGHDARSGLPTTWPPQGVDPNKWWTTTGGVSDAY